MLLFFICCFSSFCCSSSFTFFFPTSSRTLPWNIAGFLHPLYTFSTAHRRVICDTFIFNQFQSFSFYLLSASAAALSGHFLPTGVFYLTLLHRYFNLRLSRLPWEPTVLPRSLQGFILILKTQTWHICLFDLQ